MNLTFILKSAGVSILVVDLLTGFGTVPFFAQSTEKVPGNYGDFNGVTPYDMEMAKGTYAGTQFFDKYQLSSSNGKMETSISIIQGR